jgi:hypothetical protein
MSRQLVYEGGKVVSPTHRTLLSPPQIIFLILISVRGSVEPSTILQPEGPCQEKNSNELATSQCIKVCKFSVQVWMRLRLIQTCILNGYLYRVTYTRCRIDTINSPDDGHMAARNM